MKYLSLFSGIGGFEIGITNAFRSIDDAKVRGRKENSQGSDEAGKGLHAISGETTLSSRDQHNEYFDSSTNEGQPHCIGYSEIDPYADAIYKYNFGGTNYGDVTKINPTELPDFDLLVGGFPCQAFSIAGKRRGFEDTRGTLIFDVLRILKEKQPRHFILENVKGLLSHDSGRTFKTIITSLAELGYAVEWQVLNAKNFGVPQNRERVFIVGHLADGCGCKKPWSEYGIVFPIRGTDKEIDKTKELPEQISNTLRTNYSNGHSNETYVGELDYVGAVMSENNEKWLEDGKELSRNFPQGQRVYSSKGISSTMASQAGGLGAKTGLYEIDDYKIRRLTPTECERLMGYPDDWTKYGLYDEVREMSDTRRYKACGNGVVSNVVEEVVRRLYK